MGSPQFLLELHNALEPWCFARALLPASEIKFKIKCKTKGRPRFMGSSLGLAVVHHGHEPRRSSFQAASKSKSKSKNRFMGSVRGFSSVQDNLEPKGTFNVQRSTFNDPVAGGDSCDEAVEWERLDLHCANGIIGQHEQ
jgi:hypothetical protein